MHFPFENRGVENCPFTFLPFRPAPAVQARRHGHVHRLPRHRGEDGRGRVAGQGQDEPPSQARGQGDPGQRHGARDGQQHGPRGVGWGHRASDHEPPR